MCVTQINFDSEMFVKNFFSFLRKKFVNSKRHYKFATENKKTIKI